MASSRLKKRAAEDDSLQDNNLNESFVQYGTALPSLASTKKDQGEYVPVWKQEVRDEQGRRRLHGAFTGGFSAGYHNTVGSKEGWAPSTFVSKKEAKGKQREQRPEDFMDEEDLAELKASRTYTASESYGASSSRPEDAFAGLGSTAGPSRQSANAQDPGYAAAVANSLKDLVKPGSRRIGQKIMTKMGWRPGQGVGPRISYAQHQKQMKELGLSVGDEEEADDEEAKKHTFAPLDREVVLFEVKDDQRGLGYLPGKTLSRGTSEVTSAGGTYSVPASHAARFGSGKDSTDKSKQTQMPSGGAFGISALEDMDEDDDDVYGTAAAGSRNLVLNDDEDDADDAFMGLGGRRRPELLGYNKRKQTDERAAANQAQEARAPVGTAYFLDGTKVIPGFVLATKPQPPDKLVDPSPVPKNWQPNPRAVWERECLKPASAAMSGAANIHPSRKGQLNGLGADDRAALLGEPVAPKSVFDYLSAKDRARLQGTAHSAGNVDSTESKESAPQEEIEALRVPHIDARIAQSALKGFMPYGDDPRRQARYRAFLQHHAMPQDPSKPFAPTPLPGKTIGDLNIELDAFASAAMIFKPMSGMMANRFTSGSTTATLLDVNTPLAGLRQPAPAVKTLESSESEEEKQRRLQEERELADPRRAAVRDGNFGFLTRTTEPWYPARLLCKRFNVADPHPDGAPSTDVHFGGFGMPAGATTQKDLLNPEAMSNVVQEQQASGRQDTFLDNLSFATPATESSMAAEEESKHGDAEDPSSVEAQKPSMDIFKAIFASDDEDDSDEGESGIAPASAVVEAQHTTLEDPSKMPDTSMFDPKPIGLDKSLTSADLATFKPTFISRNERTSMRDENKRKDKDKKRKKKAAAVVSFEMDDGDEETPILPKESERKVKKRKGESKSNKEDKPNGNFESVDEEAEWVEKEVPMSAKQQKEQLGASHSVGAGIPRKTARVTASELF